MSYQRRSRMEGRPSCKKGSMRDPLTHNCVHCTTFSDSQLMEFLNIFNLPVYGSREQQCATLHKFINPNMFDVAVNKKMEEERRIYEGRKRVEENLARGLPPLGRTRPKRKTAAEWAAYGSQYPIQQVTTPSLSSPLFVGTATPFTVPQAPAQPTSLQQALGLAPQAPQAGIPQAPQPPAAYNVPPAPASTLFGWNPYDPKYLMFDPEFSYENRVLEDSYDDDEFDDYDDDQDYWDTDYDQYGWDQQTRGSYSPEWDRLREVLSNRRNANDFGLWNHPWNNPYWRIGKQINQ